MGRRVFVVEAERSDGIWSPRMSSIMKNVANQYVPRIPDSRVVPYIPAEEAEEELEVYKLALRKACEKPTLAVATPAPDPYDYVCQAREDIAAHKAKTKKTRIQ